MTETRRRTRIPCLMAHSNLSLNSHQSVVNDALPRILESLLQNPVEPNLSTKATHVVLLLPH